HPRVALHPVSHGLPLALSHFTLPANADSNFPSFSGASPSPLTSNSLPGAFTTGLGPRHTRLSVNGSPGGDWGDCLSKPFTTTPRCSSCAISCFTQTCSTRSSCSGYFALSAS